MITMTISASRQSSHSITAAMAMICRKPLIIVSMISWTVPPIRDTSSVIRWRISPTGVSSTNLTGRRRILSEILIRRSQVK